MSNQALRNAYDVIVVGGGIGGLTSGALLAKEGKRVLVVEQEEHPGGFAREFGSVKKIVYLAPSHTSFLAALLEKNT